MPNLEKIGEKSWKKIGEFGESDSRNGIYVQNYKDLRCHTCVVGPRLGRFPDTVKILVGLKMTSEQVSATCLLLVVLDEESKSWVKISKIPKKKIIFGLILGLSEGGRLEQKVINRRWPDWRIHDVRGRFGHGSPLVARKGDRSFLRDLEEFPKNWPKIFAPKPSQR